MEPLILGLGLTLPYGLQPGGVVTLDAPVAALGERTQVVVRGRAGAYTRPGVHETGLVEAGAGIRLAGPSQRVFHTVALGVAAEIGGHHESWSVDLGSGVTTPTRSTQLGLTPTVRWRLQHQPGRVGWFMEPAVGHQLNLSRPSQAFVGLDLGVTWTVR